MPRPKGSKNKATLLKEMSLERVMKNAQGYLLSEVEAVLQAVVEKAKAGDMQAAKLVLERAIPARRSVDELPNQRLAIQINITPSEISYAEPEQRPEALPDGESDAHRQGSRVVAFARGPERGSSAAQGVVADLISSDD